MVMLLTRHKSTARKEGNKAHKRKVTEKDTLVHRPQRMTRGLGKRIVLSLVVLAITFAAFILFKTLTPFFSGTLPANGELPPPVMGGNKLTKFDQELGLRLMDKNHDGKCDSCGMPVEMCLDSGEIECTMDEKSTIGKIGSQHIHADFKVYINGEAVDFSNKAHMERMKRGLPVSSFIHVDSGAPAPEKAGDALHMHATGVPLWIFFESIGMKFKGECLTLETGMEYCNNGNKALNVYVNGQQSRQYGEYVFRDGDKILISYDDKDKDVAHQLGSITNFAKDH